MSSCCCRCGAAWLLLACSVPAMAQEHQHPKPTPAKPAITASATPTEKPVALATRASQTPRVDGILDEADWKTAAVVDQFVQQEPQEGQPASDRTEVRILYDESHLYIGVRAYTTLAVTATEMRRDADRLFDEDNFQVILDTFHDSRNGYMFLTTPLGAKLEQQIFDEGEGGGRGTTANVNRNWEGVWDGGGANRQRRLDRGNRNPVQHRPLQAE